MTDEYLDGIMSHNPPNETTTDFDDTSDRIPVTILGRNLGTASGWDGDDFAVAFYEFRPADGVDLAEGDLNIDMEAGYIEQLDPESGEVLTTIDAAPFLAALPRPIAPSATTEPSVEA